jgi:hypothetical protein
MGYFQGNVEVEARGDLHGAGMVCPGLMEVDRTTRTQQGRAGVSSRRRRRLPLRRLGLQRETGEGCGGLSTITGGTGKFSKASGLSLFWMRSTVAEAVTTVPERRDRDLHRSSPVGGALKYTTP